MLHSMIASYVGTNCVINMLFTWKVDHKLVNISAVDHIMSTYVGTDFLDVRSEMYFSQANFFQSTTQRIEYMGNFILILLELTLLAKSDSTRSSPWPRHALFLDYDQSASSTVENHWAWSTVCGHNYKKWNMCGMFDWFFLCLCVLISPIRHFSALYHLFRWKREIKWVFPIYADMSALTDITHKSNPFTDFSGLHNVVVSSWSRVVKV